MANAKDDRLEYCEGPYEQWALGIGASYVDGEGTGASWRHYVAIATLPTPVVATEAPEVSPSKGAKKFRGPRLPTIWGVSAGIRHRFLPVIAEVRSGDGGVSYRSVWNWAGSLVGPQFLKFDAPGAADDAIPASGKTQAGSSTKASTAEALKSLPGKTKFVGLEYGLEPKPDFPLGLHLPAARMLPAETETPGLRLNVPLPVDTIDQGFSRDEAPARIGAAMGRASLPEVSGRPRIVITAVIDDGIAFAHRNFRDRNDKSRVESCWLQSARQDGSGRVLFGREFFRHEIDECLDAAKGDEERVYASIPMSSADRAYGMTMRRFATHGTHVLDIAAGHRHGDIQPFLPAPEGEGLDRVRIIAVQLPPSAIADTAGFGKDAYFLSAFHYIFERADAVFDAYGVKNPADQWLTVNFSYGATGGPHDGTGRIERAIQELIEQRRGLGKPTHVIMPAGNTFSSALYGEIRPGMLKDTHEYTIPWRVQPNNRAASHLEMWFPANPVGAVLEIVPPGGAQPFSLTLDSARTITLSEGARSYGQASLSEFSENKWFAVLSLAPTEPGLETLPAAPAGLWRIRFRQPAEKRFENPVYCRIQRCDNPFGFTTGARQSYFDDPRDKPFNDMGALAATDTDDAFVRRFGSLNGLAIGDQIWIVGGVYADSHHPTGTSAAGPFEKRAGRPHPYVNLSAPSDDSRVLPGRRAAGTLTGSSTRLSGTSVASPLFARRVALAALAGQLLPLDIGKLGSVGYETIQGVIRAKARMGDYVLTEANSHQPV